MHNRSYNEQDAIQRLLLFEEGLSRLIELMKIEKKDVLGNDMDFLCQSIMQDVCRKCHKYEKQRFPYPAARHMTEYIRQCDK